MAASGDKLIAVASASSRVDSDGSTTSTSYTATLTGSTFPGVAFVAPPSGKVTILFAAATYNSAASQDMKTAVQVRTGGTVGSGTIVYAATDSDMILTAQTNGDATRHMSFAEVTGLTAGDTYNAQMLGKVENAANTGHWLFKFLKVIPDL